MFYTAGILAVCWLFSQSLLAYPLEITHRLGQTTIAATPQRVVTLGVGALDALDYFGIAPIGVSKEDIPDYLSHYQHEQYAASGRPNEPNFEAIYNLKPDLIIAGPRSARSYDELSKIAPTVIFAAEYSGYWQSTQAMWRMLGKIFAIELQVEQTIAAFDQQFAAIKARNTQHPRSALTLMHAGGKISSFGPESRFSIVYREFGFTPSVAESFTATHGHLISYEFIAANNPQTILLINKDEITGRAKQPNLLPLENALVKPTRAYQSQQIKMLDSHAWYIAIAGVTATQRMLDDIKSL